ncbi:excisionase [Streptomyces sp. ME19-03-3]|nr:excisionase [Streptomyces sp. ME19-03-3]
MIRCLPSWLRTWGASPSRASSSRTAQKRRAPRCIKLPNGDLRIRHSDLDHWLDDHEDAA